MKVLAPTGVAAVLVKGHTIMSFFGLIPSQPYKRLDVDSGTNTSGGAGLRAMRDKLEGVKVICIDERSMVSRNLHGKIKTRLEEVIGNNKPYGGVSIIWFGDDAQLPPVKADKLENPVIKVKTRQKTKRKPARKKAKVTKGEKQRKRKRGEGESGHANEGEEGMDVESDGIEADQEAYIAEAEFDFKGVEAWKNYFFVGPNMAECKPRVFVLTENVRASGDPELKAILTAIRNGQVTEDMFKKMEARWLQSFGPEEKKEFVDAMRLVPTNAKRAHINTSAIKNLSLVMTKPVVRVRAVDINERTHRLLGKQVATRTAGGLLEALYLCVGMRVITTDNLWVQMGLVNGTTGILLGMYYKQDILDGDGTPETTWPSVVLVQMDEMYTGPSCMSTLPRVVAIKALARKFKVGQGAGIVHCKREQFPLQPAFALTIHKSQGLTVGPTARIKRIVIDIGLGQDFAAGLSYVGLSRAQLLACMALEHVYTFETRWRRLGTSNTNIKVRAWLQILTCVALHQARQQQ
jgi:hypothetical protein